ncbi:hypothetical protein GCWU000342_02232 [Shuttleworthella satelles DSM 14600]|uniref:Uncharacterized protein n=1 Tax=Shuttleworthella satelles DSM 14600 TaxID=626523 RepID=C4GDQ8_9FIRM|nr:hypothetical protein GCWU000342_02232 [Shuttleworthia satelles DSM 14600]
MFPPAIRHESIPSRRSQAQPFSYISVVSNTQYISIKEKK